MKRHLADDPQACPPPKRERIRYFTGRHLSARDFDDADAYHRDMRLLHNRVLHGWGVACGLEVRAHDRPECGVVIGCGMAIDCCGREVLVPAAVAQRIDWERVREEGCEPESVLLLCLEYCEVPTEKVPVLYSPDACSSAHYEDGRIREGYRLHWHAVKESDLDDYGWHRPAGCPPDDDPCGPAEPTCAPKEPPCCLTPRCPPDHCVAIAVVRGDEDHPRIETLGRRSLAPAQDALTHICWISWPHGGVVKLSDFKQLSVRFDQRLQVPADLSEAGPVGINERTFQVQYGAQREDVDFVMFHKHPPRLLPDRRTAVFEVLSPETYRDQTIHVTLRCDFILDHFDNPVDGTHLRGRRPTGNGTPGGVFESWFRVVRDSDYDALVQAADATGGQA